MHHGVPTGIKGYPPKPEGPKNTAIKGITGNELAWYLIGLVIGVTATITLAYVYILEK